MAGVTRNLSLEQFVAETERITGLVGQVSYRKPLQSCRQIVVSDMKENFDGAHSPDGTPWKPLAHPRASSRGADHPLKDRGILAASIIKANSPGHVEELTDSHVIVGTNIDYARIHQEGGTITPKKGKYLSIPITKDAVRAGGARNFPRKLQGRFGKRGGVLYEVVSKGKGKRATVQEVVHYVLVKSVTIPARPFVGISLKAASLIGDVFLRFWNKLLGGEEEGGGSWPR